ncbi:hypothetical protein PROFUN_13198 [Planoprotostelium fungivorum]|uniref:Uncharacterized protein n=1 Tax=Planoprotostelium fungivorum TaxID=1890364 RepID=A0A2P6N512_9EUKA|nr:hypothetical protein PROFUN_13198 [Planoprotostelium fungivorum]
MTGRKCSFMLRLGIASTLACHSYRNVRLLSFFHDKFHLGQTAPPGTRQAFHVNCRSEGEALPNLIIPPNRKSNNMKVTILFAIFFCLAAVRAADFADNFPQPPYNAVQTVSTDTPTSVTCPDNCGNPNSKYCYWNADIQDTCSATYAEKRSVEERQAYGGCRAILACGPVCWSDGQGGTVCACVSCGK